MTRRSEAHGDLRIRGHLTIRGRSQPVELQGTLSKPLTDPYGHGRIGAVVSTTVDRTSFGLEWNAPLPSGEPALADRVRLVAELFFKEQG